MLWSKYWVGTLPLLVLALAITVLTNVLLQASDFMMAVGVGTIVLLTLAVSAMALGFGAMYPQFDTENAAQIPTSYGGLLFMMSTVALLAAVIVVEAAPVYTYLQAARRGEPIPVNLTMIGAFGAVVVLCLGATAVALRVGLRRVELMEF
jgi:ABC-2 type transport system permease protein